MEKLTWRLRSEEMRGRPLLEPRETIRGTDLMIILADGSTYEASGEMMAQCSSAFFCMFSPNSHFNIGNLVELPMEQSRHVTMWEDDPEAMLLILRAVHSQKVTRYIDDVTLYELAVICDKYDLSAYLEPFTEFWMDHWFERHRDAAFDNFNLFLAWAFKLDWWFNKLTKLAAVYGVFAGPKALQHEDYDTSLHMSHYSRSSHYRP